MRNIYLSVLLLIFSLNLFCQTFETVNTKDLLKISNTFGLDSALNIERDDYFCFLDSQTAKEIALKIVKSNFSDRSESFLCEFSNYGKADELSTILNDYIEKKTNQVNGYRLEDFNNGFPKISNDELNILASHPNKNREKILIEYYNAWLKKSELYKGDYLKGDSLRNKFLRGIGIKTLSAFQIDSLLSPASDCYENCFRILVALKKIGSSFSTNNKIQLYNKLRRDGMEKFSFPDYQKSNLNEQKLFKKIKLNSNYDSIGDINFKAEVNFQKFIENFKDSDCTISIIYNKNLGFLDLYRYLSNGGYRECYRISLLNKNQLLIYSTESHEYIF